MDRRDHIDAAFDRPLDPDDVARLEASSPDVERIRALLAEAYVLVAEMQAAVRDAERCVKRARFELGEES